MEQQYQLEPELGQNELQVVVGGSDNNAVVGLGLVGTGGIVANAVMQRKIASNMGRMVEHGLLTHVNPAVRRSTSSASTPPPQQPPPA